MGTRHLTMVYSNGQYKVAQYGQWDGYLEAAGLNVLHFLKTANLEKFKKNLEKCRFYSDEEIAKLYEDLGIKAERFISIEDSNKFTRAHPTLSRDLGTDILEEIEKSDLDEIPLTNSITFFADGLFCEFAYLIDLDAKTFSVYSGNGKMHDARFEFIKDMLPKPEDYDPPKLLATLSFDSLPYDDEFLEL